MKYSKTSHITIIEEIANGMNAANNNDMYLELGIAKAKCFNQVAPHFNQNIAVDISKKSLGYIDDNIKCLKFESKTDDFFERIKMKHKFNMIFIDADHSFDQLKKDFVNSFNVLAIGGIICIHDTYPPSKEYLQHCKDSYKITDWIRNQNIGCGENESDLCGQEIEILTLPFYYGITIVRKVPQQKPWE